MKNEIKERKGESALFSSAPPAIYKSLESITDLGRESQEVLVFPNI